MTIVVKLVDGVCKVDPYETGDVPFMHGWTGGTNVTWEVCNQCGQDVDVRISSFSPHALNELFVWFDPLIQASGESVASDIPTSPQLARFRGMTTSDSSVAGHMNDYLIEVKFSGAPGGWHSFDPQLQLDEGQGFLPNRQRFLPRYRLVFGWLGGVLGLMVAFLLGRRFGPRPSPPR
jgi:hypothetical protein